MPDPFNLNRFLLAQDPVIDSVAAELTAGKKRTHWMWFIFPQLAGLGRSAMAQKYAIANLAEAQAYLNQPMLGKRLTRCTQLVLNVENRTAHQIFGSPDDLKFHSSMTLFQIAAPELSIYRNALIKYFSGNPDENTITLLNQREVEE